MSNEAYIISAVRTAVGKANRGGLRNYRPEDMGAAVLKAAVERASGLEPANVDDILLGCAMPEGEQGLNMGRLAAQRAGFPVEVPAATINRFCSSGLQTIAMAHQAITAGHADVVIAGGAESMSMVPMSGFHFSANPGLAAEEPEMYIPMGLTAENVAAQYKISREDQDAFSLRSHQRALAALAGKKFNDEIVPLAVTDTRYVDGRRETAEVIFDTDEGPRADSTLEALGKLRPAFKVKGSVTAGNASQMSDGAGACLVASGEAVKRHNLKPIAKLIAFAVAGVAPEVMGIGPVAAIPKAVKQSGLQLSDIGLIELNEAFAVQALAVIRDLGLDEEKVNVNGGAIALGHPLGATGAKLTATLLYEMQRRDEKYGMVTMCIGGGMGAAGIFELL